MSTTDEVFEAFQKVLAIVDEREPKYGSTWRCISVKDLIAIARVKTVRASSLLKDGIDEKALDDLIDSIAYLLFALAKLRQLREVGE